MKDPLEMLSKQLRLSEKYTIIRANKYIGGPNTILIINDTMEEVVLLGKTLHEIVQSLVDRKYGFLPGCKTIEWLSEQMFKDHYHVVWLPDYTYKLYDK